MPSCAASRIEDARNALIAAANKLATIPKFPMPACAHSEEDSGDERELGEASEEDEFYVESEEGDEEEEWPEGEE